MKDRTHKPASRRELIVSLAIVGGVIALLTYRITIGIDFSDESYYAVFLQDWLLTGVTDGPQLIIHQTGALLLYPIAKAYEATTGGTDGLILMLRFVYLALALCCSAVVYAYASRIRGRRIALASALFVATFIPFSSPAPSYNTLAMFGFLGSLCLIGLADQERAGGGTRVNAYLWVAGAGFASISFAYPPFVVAIFGTALVLCVTRRWRLLGPLSAAFVAVSASLIAVAISVLGLTRLSMMLTLTTALYEKPDGSPGKLGTIISILFSRPYFVVFCVVAFVLGLAVAARRTRTRPAERIVYLTLLAGLLTASALLPPALFSGSNDQVVLLSLFGISTVGISLQRNASVSGQLIRPLFWCAIIGGLATVWSATYGPYNFPVGGLGAAVFALAFGLTCQGESEQRATEVTALIVIGLAAAFNMVTDFRSVYGEPSGFKALASMTIDGVTVDKGAYAGLRTSAEKASLIASTADVVHRHCPAGGSLLAFGQPGAYLITGFPSATPASLSTSAGSAKADQIYADFYAEERHQPNCILVEMDGPLAPIYPSSPAQVQLLKSYRVVVRERLPNDAVRFELWKKNT